MLLEAPSPVTLSHSGHCYSCSVLRSGGCALTQAGSGEDLPLQLHRFDIPLAATSNSRIHRRLSPHWNPDRMTDATPFVPQSQYDKAELVACGMGELFGAGNAQLPVENMLMVDRISHISSEGGAADKGELIAELDIHPDLWFFACHFPGDPVMPGCLGLDAMWQLVGFFLGWRGNPGRGRALGCGEVKFTGQILPDHKQVRYHIHMKRVIERKLVMGIADGSVAVDGEVIYTASDLRVGLFQNTESM